MRTSCSLTALLWEASEHCPQPLPAPTDPPEGGGACPACLPHWLAPRWPLRLRCHHRAAALWLDSPSVLAPGLAHSRRSISVGLEATKEERLGLGFLQAAWAALGTGHWSLQLMFVLKVPNVPSGQLSPTKKANDFHTSFFSTLIPLPRLLGLYCHCLQTGIKSLPKGAAHLGRARGGPTLLPWPMWGHFQVAGPQDQESKSWLVPREKVNSLDSSAESPRQVCLVPDILLLPEQKTTLDVEGARQELPLSSHQRHHRYY